jgi:hypothetical protein
MSGPAGYRTSFGGRVGRNAATDDDLLAMRRAAWRKQGVVVLRPEDVQDDWVRQALVNEVTRLYGPRREAGR